MLSYEYYHMDKKKFLHLSPFMITWNSTIIWIQLKEKISISEENIGFTRGALFIHEINKEICQLFSTFQHSSKEFIFKKILSKDQHQHVTI